MAPIAGCESTSIVPPTMFPIYKPRRPQKTQTQIDFHVLLGLE